MGFQRLYPVNPGESEILGVKAYRTLADTPDPVDLAIVVTPTDSVLAAVKECAAKKVQAIVIVTSGFGETGAKGKELEQEMVRIARNGGARIIGPNCVGIYCPSSRLPFFQVSGKESGSVGVVSQSGFFADFLTLTVTGNGIAFSKAISCGNESDLNAIDFLEYLGEDPQTETIVSYVEGMKDGRRFYHIQKRFRKRSRSSFGRAAAQRLGQSGHFTHRGSGRIESCMGRNVKASWDHQCKELRRGTRFPVCLSSSAATKRKTGGYHQRAAGSRWAPPIDALNSA